MNAINALSFAALGSIMELLPRVCPAWFPPAGSDEASARALWLVLMGVVQITLGLGFIIRAHLIPATVRIFSSVPAGERGSLVLPSARAVTSR